MKADTMSDEAIRSGYKRTEVGEIPVDWEIKSLGELFDFLPTSSLPRNSLSDTGDIYYIHYGDIHTKWDYYLDFGTATVPQIASKKVTNAARLRDGDLIMVDASEDEEGVGKSVEVVNLGNRVAVAGLHTLALRSKERFLANGFKAYLQANEMVKAQIRRIATGLKVFGISKNSLSGLLLPLPDRVEQSAIAEALSDVDALLNALDRLIAKKRAIKQGAMQALLTGRVRLPGFSGEWRTTRIGDLLDYERPEKYIVHNTEYVAVGTPVLTANKSFVLGYTDEEFGIYADLPVIVFDDFTTDSKYADFSFKVKSSAIKLLKPKDGRTNLKYMFERMKLINFSLGDHKRYYISEYQNIEIPVPSPKEQHAIAEVLSDMDAEIGALEQRRAKLRDIKQGMMQELLTGRIRLVLPQERAQEAHV